MTRLSDISMLTIGGRSRIVATIASISLITALASCRQVDDPSPVTGSGEGLQVLNATRSAIDVLVDGVPRRTALEPSVASGGIALAPGAHSVVLRAPGGGRAEVSVTTGNSVSRSVVAYEGAAGVAAGVLPDTGAVVAEGKSKVRVVNLAPNSSIDIWRTQPDYQTGIRFQFPFPYNPEPSPYFQSDAGEWNVWITPTSDWSMRLAEARLDVPSGGRRTVAVVDSSGVLRLRVLVE
jgi:hypothetical protein